MAKHRTTRLRVLEITAVLFGFAVHATPSAEDLAPLASSDWTRAHAEHLLERAGFGATPAEIDRLAALAPAAAVAGVLTFQPLEEDPPFVHSGSSMKGSIRSRRADRRRRRWPSAKARRSAST